MGVSQETTNNASAHVATSQWMFSFRSYHELHDAIRASRALMCRARRGRTCAPPNPHAAHLSHYPPDHEPAVALSFAARGYPSAWWSIGYGRAPGTTARNCGFSFSMFWWWSAARKWVLTPTTCVSLWSPSVQIEPGKQSKQRRKQTAGVVARAERRSVIIFMQVAAPYERRIRLGHRYSGQTYSQIFAGFGQKK